MCISDKEQKTGNLFQHYFPGNITRDFLKFSEKFLNKTLFVVIYICLYLDHNVLCYTLLLRVHNARRYEVNRQTMIKN